LLIILRESQISLEKTGKEKEIKHLFVNNLKGKSNKYRKKQIKVG
jgi:hypothetical protein